MGIQGGFEGPLEVLGDPLKERALSFKVCQGFPSLWIFP